MPVIAFQEPHIPCSLSLIVPHPEEANKEQLILLAELDTRRLRRHRPVCVFLHADWDGGLGQRRNLCPDW